MKQVYKYSATLAITGLLAVISPASAFAATINLSPSSGTFPATRPFTVDVVINEQTDAFNAAQANLILSNNLTPTDLTLGDCDFSFVKTPTVQDPSFVGVTLGDSKKNCTVYTLTLIPSGNTEGTIAIEDGSVKRYGDANELLSAVGYGKYTVGAASVGSFISNLLTNNSASNQLVPVTNASSTISTEKDLDSYTVAIKVTDSSNKPLKDADVQLSSQEQSTGAETVTAKTDDQGVAKFTSVSPNVYQVKASTQDQIIAQAVINAKGSNDVLILGMQDERPQNPLPLIIGLVLVAIALAYFIRAKVWTLFYKANVPVEGN